MLITKICKTCKFHWGQVGILYPVTTDIRTHKTAINSVKYVTNLEINDNFYGHSSSNCLQSFDIKNLLQKGNNEW